MRVNIHQTIRRLPGHDDNHAAARLYQQIRTHDQHLSATAERAMALVAGWTSHQPTLVGSLPLRLNLSTGDFDIDLGVQPDQLPDVLAALDRHADFVAERRSTPTTTRHVFAITVDGVSVDIAVLPPDDLTVLLGGLARCHAGMTEPDRMRHVWHKHLLHDAGHRDAYAEYKLGPYRTYCPEFTWTPILN